MQLFLANHNLKHFCTKVISHQSVENDRTKTFPNLKQNRTHYKHEDLDLTVTASDNHEYVGTISLPSFFVSIKDYTLHTQLQL